MIQNKKPVTRSYIVQCLGKVLKAFPEIEFTARATVMFSTEVF